MDRDLEVLTKSVHSSGFLCDEIRSLVESENAILSDAALDLLTQAMQTDLRLKRLLEAVQSQSSKTSVC